jgi:hypothetical protein
MKNDHWNTDLSNALRRLQSGIDVPPLDPGREEALLAAFDAHWAHRTHPPQGARPRPRAGRWAWTLATAASIAIAVALDWLVLRHAPPAGGSTPDPVVDMVGFVPWPGAHTWPPFESGELVRVDLPVSSLPALGLWPPPSAGSVVQADIVIAQDGFARAVRLVQ